MAEAQYEILIPKTDTVGNPLKDLAPHAFQYVKGALQLTKAHVEQARRVFMNDREEDFDALVFVAEDSPQTDSHAKQVASYLGELSNQDLVLVSKHGQNGIQTWPVRNNVHRPGEPAESQVLQHGQEHFSRDKGSSHRA